MLSRCRLIWMGWVGFSLLMTGVQASGWLYGAGAGLVYLDQKQRDLPMAGVLGKWRRRGVGGRAYGLLGRSLGESVGIFGIGEMGFRPGRRAFGAGGAGIRMGTRLGTWEGRIYGALDFGSKGDALYAGTGALGWHLGRWHVGLYGYVPLGRLYTTIYEGRNSQRAKRVYLYDAALLGLGGAGWYVVPLVAEQKLRLGVGSYYFVRNVDVLGKAKSQIRVLAEFGWYFPIAARATLGVYVRYAYDPLWRKQLLLRVAGYFHDGPSVERFLGLYHGVPVASVTRSQ